MAGRATLVAAAAVLLASMIAVPIAQGGSGGGISIGGDGGDGGSGDGGKAAGCTAVGFGDRNLKQGDCGSDVQTLNWILKSRPFASDVPTGNEFEAKTDTRIRDFQEREGLDSTGVVRDKTRNRLVSKMRVDEASWYDLSGRYGTCGKKLSQKTMGVAHLKLPCGSKVVIGYKGKFVRARVVDCFPPSAARPADREWDLTYKPAKKLGLLSDGAGDVRVAVAERTDRQPACNPDAL